MGNTKSQLNLKFYQNEYAPPPNDLTVGEMLEFWTGNYDKLAQNTTYIHWLFPNKDTGRNGIASPFTDEEIQAFKNDEVVLNRFMLSFDMMLDYFGMQRNGTQFDLAQNWEERLAYFKIYNGNYMKITRMLKCLRLLGMEQLRENWMHFLLKLINDRKLSDAEASYKNFWMKT